MFTSIARNFDRDACQPRTVLVILGHAAPKLSQPDPGSALVSQPRILLELPRRRSLGFIKQDDETWSCFLVTRRDRQGSWHGSLAFRPRDGTSEADEVSTAEIFREHSESEIDHKARGLGRPLLKNLLRSALHMHAARRSKGSELRRRFRTFLTENSLELSADILPVDGTDEGRLDELHSLYDSYRLDQVCHFIALVRPEDFNEAIDRILEGQAVDFGAKDRLQFAMMVVEYIETRLPLPTFEVWAQDYAEHAQEYHLYAHTLHREGRLP